MIMNKTSIAVGLGHHTPDQHGYNTASTSLYMTQGSFTLEPTIQKEVPSADNNKVLQPAMFKSVSIIKCHSAGSAMN